MAIEIRSLSLSAAALARREVEVRRSQAYGGFVKVLRFFGLAFLATFALAAGWWYLDTPAPHLIQFASPNASADSGGFSYEPYAAVLARFVNDRGLVDYRGLKSHTSELEAFAASLSGLKPEVLNSWSDQERIAFWINAYNALTLEVILRNYPIKSSVVRSVVYPKNSIRQIPAVWDNFRFVIAGREMSLNDIEHATLRAKFHEPRIHVALVCAALSCPPLRNEPYTAQKLDFQLDDQARKFLRSPRGFRIDRNKSKVYPSSIFKWFPEDFLGNYGTSAEFAGKSASQRVVLNFVSRYVSDSDRDFLLHGTYQIEYLDYDWSIDEQKSD